MLSDHYKASDLPLVMKEIERIFAASQKALQMAESAQFERREDVSAEFQGAFENLFILNRKKRDADTVRAVNEEAWKMF